MDQRKQKKRSVLGLKMVSINSHFRYGSVTYVITDIIPRVAQTGPNPIRVDSGSNAEAEVHQVQRKGLPNRTLIQNETGGAVAPVRLVLAHEAAREKTVKPAVGEQSLGTSRFLQTPCQDSAEGSVSTFKQSESEDYVECFEYPFMSSNKAGNSTSVWCEVPVSFTIDDSRGTAPIPTTDISRELYFYIYSRTAQQTYMLTLDTSGMRHIRLWTAGSGPKNLSSFTYLTAGDKFFVMTSPDRLSLVVCELNLSKYCKTQRDGRC